MILKCGSIYVFLLKISFKEIIYFLKFLLKFSILHPSLHTKLKQQPSTLHTDTCIQTLSTIKKTYTHKIKQTLSVKFLFCYTLFQNDETTKKILFCGVGL